MKTLDEVITELEDEGVFPDALYHLKMYRSDMQMYADNQKYWEDELKQKIKDFGDAQERYIAKLKELEIGTLNNPLTWDELLTMEGEPVWVETKTEGGRWGIVREFRLEDETRTTCIGFTPRIFYHVLFECQNGVIDCFEHNYGKTWQAYRKERS